MWLSVPPASSKPLPLGTPLLPGLPAEVLSLGEKMLRLCGGAVSARALTVRRVLWDPPGGKRSRKANRCGWCDRRLGISLAISVQRACCSPILCIQALCRNTLLILQ